MRVSPSSKVVTSATQRKRERENLPASFLVELALCPLLPSARSLRSLKQMSQARNPAGSPD